MRNSRLSAILTTSACIAAVVCSAFAGLLKCPDCGQQASDQAAACPKCGCPVSAMRVGHDSGAQVQSPAYASVRNSLIMVCTDRGNASAFVVSMGNKKYLLTNAHVLSAATQLRFTDIRGQPLTPGALELEQNSDLARLELRESDLPALAIADSRPDMNDPIVVYGNSQGEDVVTQLKGKLIGIGPEKIEVDAGFVRGNSGSPILDSHGKVLAVATYVVSTTPQEDWVVTGTRFESIRRFGVRVRPELEWISVPFDEFHAQTAMIEDMNSLVDDLVAVLPFWMENIDKNGIARADRISRLRNVLVTYDFDRNKNRYHNPDACRTFASFCNAYIMTSKNAVRMADALRNRPNAREFRNVTYRQQFISETEKEILALKKQFTQLYHLPGSRISETKWATKWLMQQTKELHDFCRILERESDRVANGRVLDARFPAAAF